MAQCCCGKYRELDEPLLVNEYIHEPVGPSKFCGPLAKHIIRDLEAELAECHIHVEQLRGALGYPVSGDIPGNPSIKNGIAEALDQRIAECKAENERLREALDGLLDGLDSNYDERCGLSDKQWNLRIKDARKALEKKGGCR